MENMHTNVRVWRFKKKKRQKNKKTFKQKVNEALLYLDMFCVFYTKKKPEIAM